MKHPFLQLAFAAAIGALAAGTWAQQYTAPAAPGAGTPSPRAAMISQDKAKAKAEYRAAEARCEQYTGNERAACFGTAKNDYVSKLRAIHETEGNPATQSPIPTAPTAGG
jgi:hypothetical protein